MLPGLIVIARVLAAQTGRSTREMRAYERARRNHPSARPSTETIDGMLYVGLRPATHDAA